MVKFSCSENDQKRKYDFQLWIKSSKILVSLDVSNESGKIYTENWSTTDIKHEAMLLTLPKPTKQKLKDATQKILKMQAFW